MISILNKDNEIFITLHAEQVFNTIFLDNSIFALDGDAKISIEDKGIYQRTLTQSTVDKVSKQLLQYKKTKINIDMRYIELLDGNVLIEFKKMLLKCRDSENEIFLYNVGGGVFASLRKVLKNNLKEEYDDAEKIFHVYLSKEIYTLIIFREKVKQFEIYFNEKLECKILNSCEPHDKKSHSSRVRLNKYINIKKIIVDYSFFCFCIYNLAIKLIQNNIFDMSMPEKNSDKCIFIHTMNSTIIGTIISQLFCIDTLLVDHLGPYNKLYVNDLSEAINYKKKYLIACDVVCMGTELRNAQTVLDVFGIDYIGCIAMVDIMPILTEEKDIFSLYNINKENNKLNYKIITDL